MGKKKNILFILLGVLLFLYIIAELSRPKAIDWNDNFSRERKIPYGCYVLRDMLPEIVGHTKINDNNESFYTSALTDTLLQNTSLVVITYDFNPDKTDLDVLLQFVKNGNHVFISAINFGNLMADTLKIKTDYNVTSLSKLNRRVKLQFVNPALQSKADYRFSRVEPVYFSGFDTLKTTVLGWDSTKHVNYICINYGKGTFLLHTTPHVFTNYHMLYTNHDYAVKALAYIENTNVIWDEYYKPEREIRESQSPIRYILSQDSLRYAYYLLMITILLYILFEGKRRQRIMPVVEPPVNSSMEFVETVGRLYFNRKDNKDLAEKKIIHFYDYIISNYFLKPDETDNKFRQQFAEKLSMPVKDIDEIFDSIEQIRKAKGISDEELVKFIKRIDGIQYKN